MDAIITKYCAACANVLFRGETHWRRDGKNQTDEHRKSLELCSGCMISKHLGTGVYESDEEQVPIAYCYYCRQLAYVHSKQTSQGIWMPTTLLSRSPEAVWARAYFSVTSDHAALTICPSCLQHAESVPSVYVRAECLRRIGLSFC